MKKVVGFLVILLGSLAQAEESPVLNLTLDTILDHLDKTHIRMKWHYDSEAKMKLQNAQVQIEAIEKKALLMRLDKPVTGRPSFRPNTSQEVYLKLGKPNLVIATESTQSSDGGKFFTTVRFFEIDGNKSIRNPTTMNFEINRVTTQRTDQLLYFKLYAVSFETTGLFGDVRENVVLSGECEMKTRVPDLSETSKELYKYHPVDCSYRLTVDKTTGKTRVQFDYNDLGEAN